MTVPLTQRRAGPFQGDGVNDEFEFGFLSFSAADVRPLLVDADGAELTITVDVDYTVSLFPDQLAAPGGTVTFTTPPAADQRVVVLSQLSFEQPVALPPGGSFRAEAVERSVDRIAILTQQLNELQARSLSVSPAVEVGDISFVLPPPAAGNALGWNAQGDGLQNYDKTAFASITAFAEQQVEFFTLTASQINVTLSQNPYALSNIQVWKDDVVLQPGADFTYTTGASFQLAVAATGGEELMVRYGRVLENSDLAQTAAEREAAVVARGGAETAQGLAEGARDASQTAQGLSEDARDASQTAQGLSEAARNASQTAQGLSEGARDAAQVAQGLAEDARDKSQDWAETPEDVEVDPGAFSAKHWAAKAFGNASTSAPQVSYDPTTSGLTATDVQAAIDETNDVAAPAGAVQFFAQNTAPTGWLKANGAAISRTTYADLFAAIGTTFGAGDGSTTFGLPDMRGEFPRGWDDGRGVDSGRAFGSAQLDQMQRITGTFLNRSNNVSSQSVFINSSGAITIGGVPGTGGSATLQNSTTTSSNESNTFDSANSPDARTSTTTSGETRARNIALLACIKF